MAKNILIVESPAKAKTLKKYLGKDFEILASYGHVRDLIPKTGAVDPEHHFKMKYALIEKNEKHLDAIAKAMKQAENLYLATDPDREGEAISWHLQEILKQKKILKDKKVHRVVFYEITRTAVLHAVAHPRDVSMDLVNAQQARRALDYLVGFNLSPLLWKKIRRGLSAGRVQSPALRLIVEREEEIEKFISQEYWTIIAAAQSSEDAITFPSKLIEYKNKKLTQFSVTNETQAKEIKETLQEAAQGFLYVVKVEKKQRKRQPSAPFTTSTLQQEAARKLGVTTQRTMCIAQQLYEGIDVGEGSVGLITYMRTDSVNLAQEALAEIRAVIAKRYGEEFLPEAPREFKTKSKNAQEAHEAIRPTHPDFIPDQIKEKLTTEQYKLYDLIWKRTLAWQMIHATLDTVAVDLSCGQGNRFRANGSVITNPGFMLVYLEDRDDGKPDEEKEEILPPLKEGEKVKLLNIEGHQHFTEPPPRYSEASLVKALEERGIGRPSTYASIISTLQNRDYVQLLQKRFHPTDVGRVVSKFLTLYFTKYVDYDFTANLEDELDAIARGEKQWVPVLEEFWQPFDTLVKDVEANISRKEVTQEEINEACPKCQKPLAIRLGKRGRFIGCTAFPECDYTRNLDETAEQAQQTQQTQVLDRACPECKSPLQVRMGRYGKFIGCTGYPACKYIEPLEKPHDTQVPCPTCHEGSLLKRKSRYGKIFYSCSKYPTCRYAIWNEPLAESCPKCQWPILTVKVTKRNGTQKVCPQKECGYAEDM